ncbi:yhbG [Wigglesworthia glossinidia endosymbiont of Glossina brevipalpis]|uniref:Lipopolysaccharide export system ATP-binding protein LptB n=1 Tax=Wigglesworthia glossinidia brevipalpis TaxID=36870 RepID=Q8D2M8_WIGBR|nr:yhbG [Wigglesworthia glossinidia endosymbiont of Glossina brevipalpis]
MSILNVKNLFKSYKNKKIISNISLNINSREIVGLAGPNGAGKTTTFYIIVGIIKQDKGNILLNNKDLSNLPLHVRAKLGIGYLPQEPSVFLELNVQDNLMVACQNRSDLNNDQRYKLVKNLMKEFNILHIKNSLGKILSGGEKRRVEIARILSIEPKFILLDEPFSGVDPISISDIKNIIKKLCKRNLGVLITDHNIREIFSICNKIYIISKGKLIASGSPKEIYNNSYIKSIYLGNNF